MGNPATTKDHKPDRASTTERQSRTTGGARVRREEKRLSLRMGVCMLLATVALTMGTYVLSSPGDAAPVMEPPLPEDAVEPVVTSPEQEPPVSPDVTPASNGSNPSHDESPDPVQTEPPASREDAEASAPSVIPAEEKSELDHLVQVVLDNIISDGMTKLEQARAVFDFTRTKISYTGDSDKSDWENGAYEGLTTRKGDCFTYYAVSRALLTALEIDNLEVQRVGGPTSHYWNLVNCGDGWYHFDATPRSSKMPAFVSFMFTDAEAADYTARAGREYYTFDGSLYPERATGEPGETENTAAVVPAPEDSVLSSSIVSMNAAPNEEHREMEAVPGESEASSGPEIDGAHVLDGEAENLSAGEENGAEQEADNAAMEDF